MQPYEWKIATFLLLLSLFALSILAVYQHTREIGENALEAKDTLHRLQMQVDYLSGRLSVLEDAKVDVVITVTEGKPIYVMEK